MTNANLAAVAQAMVAPGKGILAADESTPTIGKRFAGIGVESTESLRRDYRAMLFSEPSADQYISGVILFDEPCANPCPKPCANPCPTDSRSRNTWRSAA